MQKKIFLRGVWESQKIQEGGVHFAEKLCTARSRLVWMMEPRNLKKKHSKILLNVFCPKYSKISHYPKGFLRSSSNEIFKGEIIKITHIKNALMRGHAVLCMHTAPSMQLSVIQNKSWQEQTMIVYMYLQFYIVYSRVLTAYLII